MDAVVYDMTGRIMFELRNIELFSTISFGDNFAPGMYVINVIQGDNNKSMRIMKMK